jgi:predicted nucleic acid-binding Zn ribbon protein
MKPVAAAVPGAVAQLLREAPLSDGKIACAWKVAVGPALDRATAVKLEGTVLLVDVASAQWAREVRRSTGLILPRLRALLGRDTVTEIKVRS